MEAGYLPGMGRVVSRPLSNYVVIDVETTGLDPEKDRIIELAAVRVVRNEVVDTFTSLVNPDIEISDFISNLTGITNEMLADAPRIQDILPSYLDFIGDAVVLGHNVVFDVKFVYCACMRCFSDGFPNNFADTLRWSKRLFPEFDSYKLKDLIDRFNITVDDQHRALSDALAAHQCYQYMKQYAASIKAEASRASDQDEEDDRPRSRHSDTDIEIEIPIRHTTGSAPAFHRPSSVAEAPAKRIDIDSIPEEEIMAVKPSLAASASDFILCALIVISLFVFLFPYFDLRLPVFWSLVSIIFLVVRPLLRIHNTSLSFTNKKVAGCTGIIRKDVMETPLNKITSVSVSQGFFGKMFGYGDVSITAASASYTFPGIASPDKFRSALMQQIDAYGKLQ